MKRIHKFSLFLAIALLSTVLAIGVFAQAQWVSIDDIIVNGGYSTEVGVGQTLTIDMLISTGPISGSTNAVIGIDVYNNSGYVTSFTNQTDTLTPLLSNYSFNFEKTISLATGDYTASVFVLYDKNGTNETVYSNTSFRVVSLTPASLGVAHGDAAFNETVTFLQGIQNNGNESANATVKVWIWYDFNDNGEYDTGDSKYATEPPTKDEILGSTSRDIPVLWATPTELGDCKYTNASIRSIWSNWAYGSTASYSWTGFYLTNFNITYVEVDTFCEDYCHSGLTQTEIAPGGVITGSVELLNRGANATTVHEVTAWVEDQDGTKWLTLGATDTSLNRGGSPQYYKDNILPGHNSICANLTNTTIAHQGSLSFSFQGVLRADLPTSNTYKVVYAIDYGVPKGDILGQPYNILQPYNFKLVSAKVLDIETPSEVTYNTVLNINTIVNNTGVTSINDLSVYVDIYNSSGDKTKNFTGAFSGTSAGSTINSSSPWNIPGTGINLGNYYINATATFGNGGTSSLSVPFEIVYLATLYNDTIADSIAPYETKIISIFVQNQGPTNATMKSISARINAASQVPLGTTLSNIEVANNTVYPFNFSYYFNPTGLVNGSFEIEVDEEFGEMSSSYSPANITLLPVGIKSFSAPSQGNNETSFISTLVLRNIADSPVSVGLNLSSNLSSEINATNVILAANSTTTINYNVSLAQTGTHNITIAANYSGLPAPLTRDAIMNISNQKPDLTISSSGISFSPSSPTSGQNVTITATVRNAGLASVSAFTVEFRINGTSHENKTASVSANSSDAVQFVWTAITGTYDVIIVLDPLNVITGEVSETNNNATTSITVSSPAAPSGGGGGGGGFVPTPTEPTYLKSSVDLSGRGIADMIYSTGDALAPTKYIVHPYFAPLAGVLASSGEAVMSPETSSILFETYEDSRSGNIIKEKPELLEAGIYGLAAYYAIAAGDIDTIVISRGDLAADSLAASTFTNLIGAKMLLVKPDKVPYPTLQALKELRPAKVYIIGGEDAISPEVEKTLGKYAFTVERIGGKDRYETSLDLARKVQERSETTIVVVTDGKNPVLYAASLAVRFNSPLVYVDEYSPAEADEFLKNFKVKARLY